MCASVCPADFVPARPAGWRLAACVIVRERDGTSERRRTTVFLMIFSKNNRVRFHKVALKGNPDL